MEISDNLERYVRILIECLREGRGKDYVCNTHTITHTRHDQQIRRKVAHVFLLYVRIMYVHTFVPLFFSCETLHIYTHTHIHSAHTLCTLFEGLFEQEWFQRGVQFFPYILNEDWSPKLNAILQSSDVVRLCQFHHTQPALSLHVLDPLVGLPLWVYHQRPVWGGGGGGGGSRSMDIVHIRPHYNQKTLWKSALSKLIVVFTISFSILEPFIGTIQNERSIDHTQGFEQ